MNVYLVYIRFTGTDLFLDLFAKYSEIPAELIYLCYEDNYVFYDSLTGESAMLYAFTPNEIFKDKFMVSRKQQLFYCKEVFLDFCQYKQFQQRYHDAEITAEKLKTSSDNFFVDVVLTMYEYNKIRALSLQRLGFANLYINAIHEQGTYRIINIFSKSIQKSLRVVGFGESITNNESPDNTRHNSAYRIMSANQFETFVSTFIKMLRVHDVP